MTATAARTQAKELIDIVPDDKISFVVKYIESFTSDKKNHISVNPEKKAAFDSLLADVQNLPQKSISLNGEKEAAAAILKKYESLD